MKFSIITFTVLFSLALNLFNAQAFEVNAIDLPLYSQGYDEQRDPFKDANAALLLAKNTQRNVMIKVGGNWCDWCKRMDAFLKAHPDVYNALHENFVILKINVSDSNENNAFMKSLPPVQGYPHIYISSAQGKMLISKDTAELYINEGYSSEAWLAFIDKYKAEKNKHLNSQS